MARWHIDQTLASVQRIYGRPQRDLAAPSLNSLAERRFFVEYHYREAMCLLDQFKSTQLSDAMLIEVAWGEEEKVREFNAFMLKAGAHILACVQSIHALADILAHTIYLSLGMNLRSFHLEEWRIGATSVLRNAMWHEDERVVKELLSEAVTGGHFLHVAALANRGKHRSIVRPALAEDWSGDAKERYELRFPAFNYSKKPYPQIDVASLLKSEHDRWSKLIVDTGNAIHVVLSGRP